MRKSLMALALILSSHGYASVKCIGPESAGRKIVFFHGKQLRTPPTNIQEIDVLRRISKAHDVRIAVVTSEDIDSDGQIYWDRKTLTKAEKSFSQSITRASTCWRGHQTKDIVLMGFSSGGYLLNFLFQNCTLKNYHSIISVEASGKIDRVKNCQNGDRALNLLISRRNWDFEEAKKYATLLQQDSKVEFISFDGDHEFIYEPIHRLLKTLF